MKPSRIRVFDGLRITTDHVNHLQTAFASGIEDLRAIAGLGSVQTGLTVTVSGGQVTVAPGLAFDQQKNRLVVDQPQSITFDFITSAQTNYVCAKYEPIEDGKVEGQATLLYDSCSVHVQPELPKPNDNLVVIAKLVSTPAGIKVESVDQRAHQYATGSAAAAPSLRARQGVIKMKGTLLQISAASNSTLLAEEDLGLDFLPASVTGRTLISAIATVVLPAPAGGAPPPPQGTQFHFECRADGESIPSDSAIAQFSISTTSSSDFSDKEMARLFLELPSSSGLDALKSAYVALRLAHGAAGQLKIVSTLDWSAVPSDEAVKSINNLKPSLAWQALFAWKALGEFAS